MRDCPACTLQNEDGSTACSACNLPLLEAPEAPAWLDGVASQAAKEYAQTRGEELFETGTSLLETCRAKLTRRDLIQLAYALGKETEKRVSRAQEQRMQRICQDRILKCEQDCEFKLAEMQDAQASAAQAQDTTTLPPTQDAPAQALPPAQTLEETREMKRRKIAASYGVFQ